jgi:hypothetical protein
VEPIFKPFVLSLLLALLVSTGTAASDVLAVSGLPGEPTSIVNVDQSPITFSGSNDQVTQQFSWDEGLMIVRWTGSDGIFYVDLIDVAGKVVASPVIQYNEGPGSTYVHVPTSGQYMLKVTASSPWTVTISNGLSFTQATSFSGSNNQATDAFYCNSGRLDVTWTIDEGLFYVDLLLPDGTAIAYPVIQYNEGPGSTAVNIPSAGYYMLKVTASSPWTIALSGAIGASPTQPTSVPTTEPTQEPTTLQTTIPTTVTTTIITTVPTTIPATVYIPPTQPQTQPPVVVATSPTSVITPVPVTQPAGTLNPASNWGKRYAVGDPGSFIGTRFSTGTTIEPGNTRRGTATGPTLKPGSKSYGITPPSPGSFVRWYPAARWAVGLK